MRSRVELFEKIRRDRRLDEVSIRELADRHGTHRRTVRQALEDAVPPPRKAYPERPRPAIDEWVNRPEFDAHLVTGVHPVGWPVVERSTQLRTRSVVCARGGA